MTDFDPAAPPGKPPMAHYRKEIEQALTYDRGISTFDRVVEEVRAERAQYWPLGDSVIITQIGESNKLHFWIAGGKMETLKVATPIILEWGKSKGCTVATLTGRRGWLRSFLADTGWRDTQIVHMECAL